MDEKTVERLLELYEDTVALGLSQYELDGIKRMVVRLRKEGGHPSVQFNEQCTGALPISTCMDVHRFSNIQSIIFRSARLLPEENKALGKYARYKRKEGPPYTFKGLDELMEPWLNKHEPTEDEKAEAEI